MHVKQWTRWVTAGVVGLSLMGASACSKAPEPTAVAGAGLAWERDLGTALDRAGAESKIVMVDFYTDWCSWCRRLDETTYADPAVREALSGVVAVKLNAEKEGRREAMRYRVAGYPTIVFLSAEGREVGRIGGYLPPQPFLEELKDILDQA